MRWPVRRPILALIIWAVLIVAVVGLSKVLGGTYNDSFALPGVQSTTAQALLTELQTGPDDTSEATVVWSTASGTVGDDAPKQAAVDLMKKLADLDFVECVVGPFGENYGTTCPTATPVDLQAALDAKVRAEIAKKTGIPEDDLGEAATLLRELAPVADADPATLARIAKALPSIARVAQAPKEVIDTLAALTPKDLDVLVGLDSADIEDALSAVGGLDDFANLPAKTLAALADADPTALAAFARAVPDDVAALETVASAVGSAAGDPAVATALTELATASGLTAAQVKELTGLLVEVAPLAKADPAELAKVARALPALASFAHASKDSLDELAQLTPKDLAFLVGLTKADIDAVISAFGDLKKFSELPASTIEALAKADPAQLETFARALPDDVAQATKDMAEFTTAMAQLDQAATATSAATSQVSADGTIAYATATLEGTALTAEQANAFVDTAMSAQSETLTVGVQGSVLEGAGAGSDSSEAIGLLVAVIVLALAFGSLVAAGLPIVAALTGLFTGQLLVVIAARYMDVASFAPTLAAMIGLGVGIDYSLFVLNRYDQALRAGREPKAAAEEAVGTAGKAVAFAGSTVIVALLGMFVLRIDFFNGLAVGAASAVLMVMLSALIFLPALLSLMGRHAVGLRLPWARAHKPVDPDTSRWSRYGSVLQKAPAIPAIGALVVIGILAFPALRMEMGFPDDSSEAQGSPLRVGFELMSEGFGDGVTGPFFVAVQTQDAKDYTALGSAISALEATPGVAKVIPSSAMLPLLQASNAGFGGASGTISSVIVQPSTSPSAQETTDLLDVIRGTTAPKVESTSGARIYVGGTQAVAEDFTTVLTGALPVFLLLVVGLGFVALMLLFRSLLIPLTAAITSLLSFSAALGITVAVFQLGIADSFLGVTGTGPILPFLPIMVFAILFGLSMDYQVFLVTRMREEYEEHGDNRAAVRRGLAGSGRVVVVAATIMTSVFLSFVPTPVDTIKLFGVALASAVIVDAFIVRLILVPSLMTLFGRANWWVPTWLGKVLPNVKLE